MKLKSIFLILITLFVLTGCTTSKSFTYVVETGDKIKIKLDTSDGYNLSSELPFTISKNNQILSQGIFITLETYEQYLDAINSDNLVYIIDSGNKNGVEYLFYSYNNSEFNYILKIENSNTGILLGNPNSEEEAKLCFELLEFSKE